MTHLMPKALTDRDGRTGGLMGSGTVGALKVGGECSNSGCMRITSPAVATFSST